MSHPIRLASSRSFHELTPKQRAAYVRDIQVLGKVRRGDSLTTAARELGTTARTVRRHFPKDFSKPKGAHRWVASKSDQHIRPLKTIGDKGMEPFLLRGSAAASRQVQYLRDVRRAMTGDPKALAKWHGKRIGGRKLVTSLRQLQSLADSGTLHFEDLYSDLTDDAR